MLYLESLFFVFLGPGTATVLVPYLLLRSGIGRFDLGASRYLGLPLIATGAAVFLRCVVDFVRVGRGTPAPIDPPKVFVGQGYYRFVRNPMYIGALSILLGEALLFQSVLLAGWMLFMAGAFHLFVLFYEEPVLRRTFGGGYEDYTKKVPRWLPRLRPR